MGIIEKAKKRVARPILLYEIYEIGIMIRSLIMVCVWVLSIHAKQL
jgi:hypothetical protein